VHWEKSPTYDPDEDDGEPQHPDKTKKPMPELEEADEMQHEAYDRYISARVCVPKAGEMSYGTVMNRKRRLDGDLMGRSNANPILDTSIYEVKFDDGKHGSLLGQHHC